MLKKMSNQIRNKKLKVNIVSGFSIKGLSIALSFIFIPLVLNYLTSYKYGIWLTINSVVAWFSYFDIGLSGSLRLKLQEFFALNETKRAKEYISTTYVILFLISITLSFFFVFVLLNVKMDFSSFFKSPDEMQSELKVVLIVSVCCFFVRFALQPISSILLADQNNLIPSLIFLTENILNLFGLFILSMFTENSLLLACVIFSVSPIVNLSIYSYVLFKGRYNKIRPSLNYFRSNIIKSLSTVSIDLFIISISLILLIQSNNLLITSLFRPEQVTEYNITYKLFSSLGTAFTLVVTPLWASFGDAYHKNDFIWIKSTLYKVLKFYLFIVIGMILLVPFSSKIIFLWTDLRIQNNLLFITTAIYFIVQNFMMIFSFLFNGMGLIKIQRNIAIYGALINIPLVYLMVKVFSMGLHSVLIANTIAILPAIVIYPILALKKINSQLN